MFVKKPENIFLSGLCRGSGVPDFDFMSFMLYRLHMPFEMFGVNLETSEGQALYLEAYQLAYDQDFREITSSLTEPDLIKMFFESAPEAAKEFILRCSEHDNSSIRYLAAAEADNILAMDAEVGIALIEKSLQDPDSEVREVRRYYKDMLDGHLDIDVLESAGLNGLIKFLRAYRDSAPSIS
jgi:hypothetical protein